jgi:hypothetical protein
MCRRAFTWADKAVKSKKRGSREAAIDTATFKLKTALYVKRRSMALIIKYSRAPLQRDLLPDV